MLKQLPLEEHRTPTPPKEPLSPAARTPRSDRREEPKPHPPSKETDGIPDWLRRPQDNAPTKAGLIPTHELIRIANAMGVDIDYSTLRFWQKRGLVPKPVRGPVSTGRGTRGYYDSSLIDRLAFIRKIQKLYTLGLEAIRDELEQIDRQNVKSGGRHLPGPYQERLAALQAEHEAESKKTLLAVLSKAMGLDPDDIATVVIRKKDGQTVRFLPSRVLSDAER